MWSASSWLTNTQRRSRGSTSGEHVVEQVGALADNAGVDQDGFGATDDEDVQREQAVVVGPMVVDDERVRGERSVGEPGAAGSGVHRAQRAERPL